MKRPTLVSISSRVGGIEMFQNARQLPKFAAKMQRRPFSIELIGRTLHLIKWNMYLLDSSSIK